MKTDCRQKTKKFADLSASEQKSYAMLSFLVSLAREDIVNALTFGVGVASSADLDFQDRLATLCFSKIASAFDLINVDRVFGLSPTLDNEDLRLKNNCFEDLHGASALARDPISEEWGIFVDSVLRHADENGRSRS